MNNFRHELAGICAFNVKNDVLIKAFSALGGRSAAKSIEAYSRICGTLLAADKSLGEYLKDMLIYSDSPFISLTAENPTELRIRAVESDLKIIGHIAEYSPQRLKAELSEKYGDIFGELSDYEQGSFEYPAEYFTDFAARNGSGIFAKYKAFSYCGELYPIENTDPVRLSDLKNYEVQRNQVVENTVCFLNGKPAQNVLLYGDRGTGKSSTVKAILNEFEGLRMVELSKKDVGELPALFKLLERVPLRFIITIDDLTFSENDDRFGILKAALEGSLSARPDNILIYATTNRRKIIKETEFEREIGGADAIDESMTLADRFGLFVTFSKPNKEVYLDIVRKLAADRGICIPEEKLFAAAERFALKRGGRSPRIARQFTDWLYGRIEMGMEY